MKNAPFYIKYILLFIFTIGYTFLADFLGGLCGFRGTIWYNIISYLPVLAVMSLFIYELYIDVYKNNMRYRDFEVILSVVIFLIITSIIRIFDYEAVNGRLTQGLFSSIITIWISSGSIAAFMLISKFSNQQKDSGIKVIYFVILAATAFIFICETVNTIYPITTPNSVENFTYFIK